MISDVLFSHFSDTAVPSTGLESKTTLDCLEKNNLGGYALCEKTPGATCTSMESTEKKDLVHGGMFNWCDKDTAGKLHRYTSAAATRLSYFLF